MSFYTSLSGLKGAQTDLATISNNLANVGSTGFKKSRAQFGDLFASAPTQTTKMVSGQGDASQCCSPSNSHRVHWKLPTRLSISVSLAKVFLSYEVLRLDRMFLTRETALSTFLQIAT